MDIIDISHPTRRWREVICILIGHEWTSYSSETGTDGFLVAQSNTCERCKLAKRLIRIPLRDEPDAWKWVAY